jgi:hypothetical protein
MAKLPSTYALDTGNKLGDKFFDIRWMSTPGVVPEQRWFTLGEALPAGEEEPTEWGSGAIDDEGHLVVNYYRPEVFGSIEEVVKLWFILVEGGPIGPNMLTLFGFADGRYPWGTVVEFSEVSSILEKEYFQTWAGMVTWGKGVPLLQQVITAENWRRKRISIMMFGVCDVVNACYGFSPGQVLHGGDITTEDGEKLRNIYPGGNTVRIRPRIGSVQDAPSKSNINAENSD